jgi:hypothetical protein
MIDRAHALPVTRPFACVDADEEDGDRSDLPAAQHREAGTGAHGLSLSAPQTGGDAAQPGPGDRHHPGSSPGPAKHPHGTRLRHLIAIVDWFSRRVPSWRLSITLRRGHQARATASASASFHTTC